MLDLIGNSMLAKIYMRRLLQNYNHSVLLSCGSFKSTQWKDLISTEGKFNLPSIAVNRESVASNRSLLRQINLAADIALFLLSMASDGCVLIDPTVLTKLRVHDQNSYFVSFDDIVKFVEKKH